MPPPPENYDDTSYYAEYAVVHYHNGEDVYHLSREILLDTAISHGRHCFFYRILSDDTDAFNQTFGSFATVIPRTQVEADVYLNVDRNSLGALIRYIQNGTLAGCVLSSNLVDLAFVFGMETLVEKLRQLV